MLIIQSLLFSETIFSGGTIEELNNNSMDILNERVLRRKHYLENEISQRWTNLSKFEYDIQQQMIQFLEHKEISIEEFQNDSDLIVEFIDELMDDTISALRRQMVTGVFVVLKADSNERYPGLYIRDMDPLFNPYDNSDISIEIGPSSVAKKNNISLGRSWTPTLILKEDEDYSNFFYKPYRITTIYPENNFEDLGYWSKPFSLSQYDMEIITYSAPLIDADNNTYGVIGIELTTDYLRKILYYDEIVENKKGSYLLGVSSDENMEFQEVVSSGPLIKKLMVEESKFNFNTQPVYTHIYEMEIEDNEEIIYGSIHYLNLYNRNNPFENDKWALIGIVGENDLLKASKNLKNNVIMAIIMYLFIGIIGVIFAGMLFVRPIAELVKKLKISNPEESIVLEKTNIAEIDDLALAIESLSRKVADSASKLSQIIGMVNVPIGAFEHILDEDRVFCTDGFFNILGMEIGESESKYISSTEFYNILKDIQENPEYESDNIYFYRKNENEKIWIYLSKEEVNGRLLGIIKDVTDDVIEKQKIEYERDHDVLTNLMNRRAFQVQVRKKIAKGDFKLGAFVMWDIDNLKDINDLYGHDFGDIYIKNTAKILSEINYLNGIVARMAGDEFYAFIYGYDTKDEIRNIIKYMHKKLHDTIIYIPDNIQFPIEVSTGVSWYPDDSMDYDELIKYADFAMYESKNNKKCEIVEFNMDKYKKNRPQINKKLCSCNKN
ncbi:MAG: GGDEF domain-containing protein [Clostridiales bacterium]|nr:GGDEF domain-containing protein [Clostridiales bacterium]